MTKMISPLEAAKNLVEYTSESEMAHWRNNFDSLKEMIEDMRSANPHVYVLTCIIEGMDSEAIIQEWDGGTQCRM